VKSGKFPISKVDKCVKNILRMKFRLGLFENPYATPEKISQIHGKKALDLA
jgi:beta-glucosidase